MKQALEKCSGEQVQVKIIHGAVGAISESDVMLASASNAIIIGFNVRPIQMQKISRKGKHRYTIYRIIYDVVDDIQSAMKACWSLNIKK